MKSKSMYKIKLIDFKGEYDNLTINTPEATIEIFEPNPEIFPANNPFILMSSFLRNTANYPAKVLNGNFLIMLRNVELNSKKGISIEGLFTVREVSPSYTSAQIAHKFVEYLFVYLDGYLKQHAISESNVIAFTLPQFAYRSEDFAYAFPQ